MATTLEMLDAIEKRLKAKLPALAVEYYPEKPEDYRLNHPRGALLVSYAGSQFGESVDAGCMVQPRKLTVSVTVLLRQLHGKGGAVDVMDLVRQALVGFRPPDCRKMRAAGDQFQGENAGIWQYVVSFSMGAMQVEEAELDNGPLLTHVTIVDSHNRGETRKESDGTIIQEEFTL